MSTIPKPDWQTADGRVVLYNRDCLDVLPHLGKVDAVVTDPPYGLGDKWKSGCWKTVSGRLWDGAIPDWDREPAAREVSESLKIGSQHVIFGGNYFILPPTNAWLIWDKNQEHTGSHCEMAWTDLSQPVRKFTLSRVEAYCGAETKVHPNQKPLSLMLWCVSFTSGSVCDPMMGSGTTGVACVNLGRPFIGIERDSAYFATACRRIEAELNRVPLFEAAPIIQRTLITE